MNSSSSLHKFLITHGMVKLPVLALIGILTVHPIFGAPKRYAYEEDTYTALREMRDTLEDVRHEVNNHETEIRMYEEKLRTQEIILDAFRQEFSEAYHTQKDLLKGTSINLEAKIAGIESTCKGLAADLRQLKSHANDSASVLAQYKQKFTEIDKLVEAQNQNIDNLQAALKAMMEAMQVKAGQDTASNSPNQGKTYRIKPGDSLEKIARHNQTSVQVLKELNNLSEDKIIVGQKLQLP